MSEEDAYARKEGFPTKFVLIALAGVVILLWFVFGYGYLQLPLPAHGSDPPTIWLVYQGEIYTGSRGSYCWANSCVDKIFPNPTGTIDVAKGASVSFTTNGLIRPSSVNAQVFVADKQGNPSPVGELMGEGNDRYRVNLASGIHIVNVLAKWKDLGYVSYFFKINVR